MTGFVNEEITAGLLIRGQVRGALMAMKMYGNIEDFVETKGVLNSLFYVKGCNEHAMATFREWRRKTGGAA